MVRGKEACSEIRQGTFRGAGVPPYGFSLFVVFFPTWRSAGLLEDAWVTLVLVLVMVREGCDEGARPVCVVHKLSRIYPGRWLGFVECMGDE